MKRLLLAPLLLMLTSCGYGSLYEAQLACANWKDNQREKDGVRFACEQEPETMKMLGLAKVYKMVGRLIQKRQKLLKDSTTKP